MHVSWRMQYSPGMDAPAIDWAGGYKSEGMNERRDQYKAALRAADKYDFTMLFKFVSA